MRLPTSTTTTEGFTAFVDYTRDNVAGGRHIAPRIADGPFTIIVCTKHGNSDVAAALHALPTREVNWYIEDFEVHQEALMLVAPRYVVELFDHHSEDDFRVLSEFRETAELPSDEDLAEALALTYLGECSPAAVASVRRVAAAGGLEHVAAILAGLSTEHLEAMLHPPGYGYTGAHQLEGPEQFLLALAAAHHA